MQGARQQEVRGRAVDGIECQHGAPFQHRSLQIAGRLQQGGQSLVIVDLVGVDVGEVAERLDGGRVVAAAAQQLR